MTQVQLRVDAPREDVFEVLADGWSYSDWVVGTVHIRQVDERWPEPGTRIRHSTGLWPLSLQDTTVSLECHPPHDLLLAPRLRPLVTARVLMRLEELAPNQTLVTMQEQVEAGAARWLWGRLSAALMRRRNVESLRRLGDLAMHRRRGARRTGDVASSA